MKKILLLAMITFCSTQLHCQIIDGIGQIKLGMTTFEIKELFDNELIKKSENEIKEVFILSKFTPVKGYSINKLHLCFYNDSLYSMYSSERTNIDEALTIKYGEPQITSKEEVKYFTNGFGNKIEKTDKTFNYSWETGNPDITCYSVNAYHHISSGELFLFAFFGLQNKKTLNKVEKLENELNKREKKKDLEEKKKSLNNL